MTTLIAVHVLVSLVAIASGLVVLGGWLKGGWPAAWNQVFLWTTIGTSATGFLFPFNGVTPAILFGVVSLALLAVAVVALYGKQLAGAWGRTYQITTLVSLYLNLFVLVVQAFLKVPALNAIAPTQADPPFAIAQLVLLVSMVVAGTTAVRRFRRPLRVAVERRTLAAWPAAQPATVAIRRQF